MKKTTQAKRLLLSVEKIRDLQPQELVGVVGACLASYVPPGGCRLTGATCRLTGTL